MNSRDTDVEMNRILDISRKEAERAGTLPEVDLDTNDGRRKRKRGTDAADSADKWVVTLFTCRDRCSDTGPGFSATGENDQLVARTQRHRIN